MSILSYYTVLDYHDLSICRLRGQGYDGASNMRGEFNGLQKLQKMVRENLWYFVLNNFMSYISFS